MDQLPASGFPPKLNLPQLLKGDGLGNKARAPGPVGLAGKHAEGRGDECLLQAGPRLPPHSESLHAGAKVR